MFDANGYPIQQRGVTSYQGLYFAGMPWLHNGKSRLLFGASQDAEYVASHISNREQRPEVFRVLGSSELELAYD